ncbi:hypothetical protein [Desulfobacter postgatei]|uniref:Uncharacterized protein n=1 Tax=Desulfobacter postgatei 2ac9 TaxID=879212 RepID=I5AY14_9BACT|nr:hypothetical protein [Desulfobacter postgatei]EIM62127.1 hypothetical protein DespoDRAFT_00079 [Desulfobacter postgatei 2ac9]
MIDLEAFGNGFGLVVISLLFGIILRAIISALRIGSSRFHSIGIVFFLIILSNTQSYAAVTSIGSVDLYRVESGSIYFMVDGQSYMTSDANQIDLVNKAYYQRTVVDVADLDSNPGWVDYVQTTDTSDLMSKSISLIIGALSCNALALGLSLRF